MDRLSLKTVAVAILFVGVSTLLQLDGANAQRDTPSHLAIHSTAFLDLDGDHDMFPDTGETGRLTVTLESFGFGGTGVTVILSSADPDVTCISEGLVEVDSITPGQTFTVGSLDPTQPGFTFKVSDSLESLSPAGPARIDFCLFLKRNGTTRLFGPVCFFLPADLDLPADATQVLTPGPDGLPDTADDGIMSEHFDIDKNADGIFSIEDTFLQANDDGAGVITYTGSPGFLIRGSDAGSIHNTATAVACGGFVTPAEGNDACVLDPDFPLDWHFHCPSGAPLGADTTDTNGDGIPDNPGCPNSEILPGDTAPRTCIGGCSYQTPTGGDLGLSTPNSLHMGAHFDLTSAAAGDTTHFRALQAFSTPPINLKLLDLQPGDLNLSFFHIIDLVDNHITQFPDGRCADCADVQVQVDLDADPSVDAWGPWDKLVPFQNIYDKFPDNGTFGRYYCLFTPADTGDEPPAPRGVHETTCSPQGVWSHCGSDFVLPFQAAVGDCVGPGTLDPGGSGTWVETKFNLASFLGQRIRIRWVGMSWDLFAGLSGSYFELGGNWETSPQDDGWWLDDILVTGTVQSQTPPTLDATPAPGGSCPAETCNDLDGDGYGFPGFHTCPAGAQTDCDDANANVFPGAPGLCDGLDNNCDWRLESGDFDRDDDGFLDCADCSDNDPSIYPGAPEINDGLDNQCPGDPGYGIIDEISGDAGFHSAADNTEYSWPAQTNAILYEVARTTSPNFVLDCSTFSTSDTFVIDPEMPLVGGALYHLVRPLSLNVGSWGQDSSGAERSGVCS